MSNGDQTAQPKGSQIQPDMAGPDFRGRGARLVDDGESRWGDQHGPQSACKPSPQEHVQCVVAGRNGMKHASQAKHHRKDRRGDQ